MADHHRPYLLYNQHTRQYSYIDLDEPPYNESLANDEKETVYRHGPSHVLRTETLNDLRASLVEIAGSIHHLPNIPWDCPSNLNLAHPNVPQRAHIEPPSRNMLARMTAERDRATRRLYNSVPFMPYVIDTVKHKLPLAVTLVNMNAMIVEPDPFQHNMSIFMARMVAQRWLTILTMSYSVDVARGMHICLPQVGWKEGECGDPVPIVSSRAPLTGAIIQAYARYGFKWHAASGAFFEDGDLGSFPNSEESLRNEGSYAYRWPGQAGATYPGMHGWPRVGQDQQWLRDREMYLQQLSQQFQQQHIQYPQQVQQQYQQPPRRENWQDYTQRPPGLQLQYQPLSAQQYDQIYQVLGEQQQQPPQQQYQRQPSQYSYYYPYQQPAYAHQAANPVAYNPNVTVGYQPTYRGTVDARQYGYSYPANPIYSYPVQQPSSAELVSEYVHPVRNPSGEVEYMPLRPREVLHNAEREENNWVNWPGGQQHGQRVQQSMPVQEQQPQGQEQEAAIESSESESEDVTADGDDEASDGSSDSDDSDDSERAFANQTFADLVASDERFDEPLDGSQYEDDYDEDGNEVPELSLRENAAHQPPALDSSPDMVPTSPTSSLLSLGSSSQNSADTSIEAKVRQNRFCNWSAKSGGHNLASMCELCLDATKLESKAHGSK